ncbi:MAG: hypothetical protein P8I59_01645, partial [Pseudomonadales bacterium]|nr:hypothetical protein [Pseudomonadales bacterium]
RFFAMRFKQLRARSIIRCASRNSFAQYTPGQRMRLATISRKITAFFEAGISQRRVTTDALVAN